MPFEVQQGEGATTLVLSGRIGVQQARPLWDALNGAINSSRGIRLEAEAVQDIDTSIVQILVRVGRRSGELQVASVSDGFIASLARRGLEGFFAYGQPAAVVPAALEMRPRQKVTRIPRKRLTNG